MRDATKLMKDFWNQANDRKRVSVNLIRESDVTPYVVDGDAILVITVPAEDREIKPV